MPAYEYSLVTLKLLLPLGLLLMPPSDVTQEPRGPAPLAGRIYISSL